MKDYIIAILVENKPGVLNKISSLLRRRNFNIESISAGHTDKPNITRITLVVRGDEWIAEQVLKQLKKIIEVVRVRKLDENSSVIRQLALVKVKASNPELRDQIIKYVKIFRASIVDVNPRSVTVEITGDSDKVNAFVDLMRKYEIIEMARTGITALTRGKESLKVEEQ
jgi:acetolactate synthase-1/3 small subunit